MFYVPGVMMFLSIVDFSGQPVDLSKEFVSFPPALAAWAVFPSLLHGQHVCGMSGCMLASC